MEKLPDGSLRFIANGTSFIFNKHNYDAHCLKREALKNDWFLDLIEKTLQDPDVITIIKPELAKSNADKRKKTYYKVYKQHSPQFLEVVQIPTTTANPVCQINTAFGFSAFAWTIINTRAEKIIWQKPNSSII